MTGHRKLVKRVTMLLVISVLVLLNQPSSSIRAQMGGGGGGMGNNQDPGNMGSMSGMMLISGGQAYRHDGTMLTIEDATALATGFMNSLGNSALALDEVEEWEFNYYVVVKETAPPQYKAFQLIIDKWSGLIMPEPGPNMMWNQKYAGMMNNMTNGAPGHMTHRERKTTSPTFTVTTEAATTAADKFLHERFARTLVVAGPPDVFFGYYNFDVNDAATGAKYGMLSVNGTTGQVWYHTWHGGFVAGREID